MPVPVPVPVPVVPVPGPVPVGKEVGRAAAILGAVVCEQWYFSIYFSLPPATLVPSFTLPSCPSLRGPRAIASPASQLPP